MARVHIVPENLHFYPNAGNCNDWDLGMETFLIPDERISASSELSYHPARDGRLKNLRGAWCADGSHRGEYLQIDLQTPHIICALSTQGHPIWLDEWVTKYTLQSSIDGIRWTNYTENGQVKVRYQVMRSSMTFTTNGKMKISFC